MTKKRGGFCIPNLHASTCTVMLVLCLGLPSLVASQCKRKPIVFNFGDSNSDTGSWAALGAHFGLPDGHAFFHEAISRLCDGRLIIDFLSHNANFGEICLKSKTGESLNTSYLSAYLESLGPNFSSEANFAISGAAPYPINPKMKSKDKISQSGVPNSGYTNLVGEDGFGDALYTIDIGQNNIAVQVVQNTSTFIGEIKLAIGNIYKSGGKNFRVHNTGPLGCLPQKLAKTAHNASDTDEHGCLKSLNDAAQVFNRQLQSLCEELRSQMKNATIVYVDVFAIKYDLIANYAEHGFESSLMACCGNGRPPYNYNDNNTCRQSNFAVCDEGSRYASWDGVHYTEAANSFVASRILSSDYSTPPINFNFFCKFLISLEDFPSLLIQLLYYEICLSDYSTRISLFRENYCKFFLVIEFGLI
ncbi:GDSL esterase/lipase At1g09390-like [Syzygium oleosum]|uniref:GDSL esterase/lipase At1g09390-like n=1 Tax=Syzygium oleosum TaxID=219896 RepID=UPI0024B9C162|nr:GDSL esterase/lipase At1g09390-like [Syzygium oleosum]